jgi:hypothetical protein
VVPEAGADLRFPRWVRVGSELVRTDARGRFRTELLAPGVYSADLALARTEGDLVAEAVIVLEPGEGPRNITLRVRRVRVQGQ